MNSPIIKPEIRKEGHIKKAVLYNDNQKENTQEKDDNDDGKKEIILLVDNKLSVWNRDGGTFRDFRDAILPTLQEIDATSVISS